MWGGGSFGCVYVEDLLSSFLSPSLSPPSAFRGGRFGCNITSFVASSIAYGVHLLFCGVCSFVCISMFAASHVSLVISYHPALLLPIPIFLTKICFPFRVSVSFFFYIFFPFFGRWVSGPGGGKGKSIDCFFFFFFFFVGGGEGFMYDTILHNHQKNFSLYIHK